MQYIHVPVRGAVESHVCGVVFFLSIFFCIGLPNEDLYRRNQTDSATSVSICAPSIRRRPVPLSDPPNIIIHIILSKCHARNIHYNILTEQTRWTLTQPGSKPAVNAEENILRFGALTCAGAPCLKEQRMDAYGEPREAAGAAASTAPENEAESLQIQEEKSAELNNLNSCPVCCLNLYSREPKLLPCLHSFCKKCLPAPSRNLASAMPTNSRVDGLKPRESESVSGPFKYSNHQGLLTVWFRLGRKQDADSCAQFFLCVPVNVIRCPVCRQECMQVDVMENVFVTDSVETPSSTMKRSPQVRAQRHAGAAPLLTFTPADNNNVTPH